MNTNINEQEPVRVWSRPAAAALLGVSAVLAVLIRLIPYGMRPPNVAANGSLALFGGARMPFWLALLMTFVPMVIADQILYWMFSWERFNPAVYGSFFIYLLLGRVLLKGSDSIARIAGVSLIGTMQFFLLTNLAAWYQYLGTPQQLYEGNIAGVFACYVAGLPYLAFTLAGDLGFTAVLFGAEGWLYGLVHGTKPATAPEEVVS